MPGGTTTLSRHVRDHAELQGLPPRVSDLGRTLLEVRASDEEAKRRGRVRSELR